MTVLECFEVCDDFQIQEFLRGKMVKVKYKDGIYKKGVVTNFISAAVADVAQRSIVGITLNERNDIIVSSAKIDNISIIN